MAHYSIKPVVLWSLVIGLLVSAIVATKIELDKRRLALAYAQAKATMAQLEQERSHLNRELAQARQTIDTQSSDLSSTEKELNQLQGRFNQTEQELRKLQIEQASLRQTNTTLSQQLSAVTQEKQTLEAKLSSLKELKLAIRAVKVKLAEERRQAWLARISVQRAEDQRRLAKGNHGYVISHGVPTLGAKSALQVRVLEPQTQ